ncbi:putative membrane-anchored protein [Fontibacillus phaseoli]|uniref:Putative membrane-anchored protein n=1 Tax=Fontibacillus phaseoli TaxID=1416533 RepID=A0A369BB33_9BACL|nr:DUF2167 domain-containing protein [Fontibacillus phaseoli]RCX18545.1 putative membrane-anchored protein [Fontibacillus phaseoli]
MKLSNNKPKIRKLLLSCLILLSILAMPFNAVAEEVQEPNLYWTVGSGQKVKLTNIAELTLPQNYYFLDKDNTIAFIESFEDLPTYDEIGYVQPGDENSVWSVYFEYAESGHIEDKEKSDIDADELLKSYERGQKEANKKLPEYNQLYVEGWFKEPAYDESMRSLTWALLLHDNNGEQIINYNVRILTRVGYISAILVSTPETLEADRTTFTQELLPGLSVTPGNTYSDFDPSTDKKSSMGLTGLILGGAGLAVAKKTGVIAIIALIAKKFWIVIFAPLLWLGKLFKKKGKNTEPAQGNLGTDPNSENAPALHVDHQSSPENPEENRFKSKFEAENDPNKPPTSM